MKKIFILPILIAPIMAHATGPSAASGTAVVASVSAPYATATAENGDTTNVVSASYVKGAYNDAIAAVNKVNSDKQDKLVNSDNNRNIESKVVAGSELNNYVVNMLVRGVDDNTYNSVKPEIATSMGVQNLDDALISANIVLDGLQVMGTIKQNTLRNHESSHEINSSVISSDSLSGVSFTNTNNFDTWYGNIDSDVEGLDNALISADGVVTLIKTATDEIQDTVDSKRVNALATWGSNTVTKVPLVNNQ